MSTVASRPRSEAVRRIILMGVAGCGKSAIGAALAARLDAIYVDGDDLHPEGNIAKMSRGEPLVDDDRWPWLSLVGQKLAEPMGNLILGCSALKRQYRDHIRKGAGRPLTFVHLSGSKELIAARMAARSDHFMPTTLIDSQFDALEPPAVDENAIVVNIDGSLETVTNQIISLLNAA